LGAVAFLPSARTVLLGDHPPDNRLVEGRVHRNDQQRHTMGKRENRGCVPDVQLRILRRDQVAPPGTC
jgi:hypothetical protein